MPQTRVTWFSSVVRMLQLQRHPYSQGVGEAASISSHDPYGTQKSWKTSRHLFVVSLHGLGLDSSNDTGSPYVTVF